MLTEIQSTKFIPLFEIPKFGKILIDASNVWKLPEIVPRTGIYGLDINPFTKTYCIYEHKMCCLIGAALIGKLAADKLPLSNVGFRKVLVEHFSISEKEFHDLHRGFDALKILENSEAYNFAKSVHNILFVE